MFSIHSKHTIFLVFCICHVHLVKSYSQKSYTELVETAVYRGSKEYRDLLKEFSDRELTYHSPKTPGVLSLLTNWRALLEDGLSYKRDTTSNGLEMERLGIHFGNITISDKCFWDTMTIVDTVSNPKERWALQMVDAFGKPGSGIEDGNINWYGSYDQCMSIQPVIYKDKTSPTYPFETQYCAAVFPIPIPGFFNPTAQNLPVLISGTCLPDSCSEADVVGLINVGLYYGMQRLNINATFGASAAICQPKSVKLDDKAIGAIVLFSFIGALLLAGTLYDIFIQIKKTCDAGNVEVISNGVQEASEKTPLLPSATSVHNTEMGMVGKLLLCFSVYSNGKKILSTNHAPGSLTAMNGVRFLSMSWVVLGHSYMMLEIKGENVASYLPKVIDRWTFSAIDNALVSVDTFFTISGLLVSYLCMKEMAKTGWKINWAMFYFHRFWRLTPVYMLCVFISGALTKYLSDGPLWPKDGLDPNCNKYWWANLLYINNLLDPKKVCLGVSWYLSNDMQFYILSPLIMVPLFLSLKVGLVVSCAFLLATFITTGVLTTIYDMPMSMFDPNANEHMNDWSNKYYFKPWCRIGPYIVGILTGYILYRTEKGFKMNKVLAFFGWLVAATLALTILYGTSGHHEKPTGVRSLYNTVHRSLWGACVCWVIFACARGYGGYVNTLLSWKPFLPLGRLTYCAYLVHFLLLMTITSNIRKPFYITDLSSVYFFLATLVATMCLAFVFSVSLESPMMGLEKIIFKRGEKKK